jgi:hypothetical protein
MSVKEKFKRFQMAECFVHPSVLYQFLCYTDNNYRNRLSFWIILITYISLASLKIPSAEILVNNLYVKYASRLWHQNDTYMEHFAIVTEMYNYENDYAGLRTSGMLWDNWYSPDSSFRLEISLELLRNPWNDLELA